MNCPPRTPLIVDHLISAQNEVALESPFHFDPLTHPEEFHEEVVGWLKEDEQFFNDVMPVPLDLRPIQPMRQTSPDFDIDILNEFFCADSSSSSSSSSVGMLSPMTTVDLSYPVPQSPFTYANHTILSPIPYSPAFDQYTSPTPPPPHQMLFAMSPNLYQAQRRPLAQVHNKQHSKGTCSNCGTQETSLWRRNSNGNLECNACNIYEARNHCKRPIDLHRKKILRRKRNPRHNISPNA